MKILDDSQVYIEEFKYKTDRFYLGKITLIEDFVQGLSYEEKITLVKKNGCSLAQLINQLLSGCL